MFEKEREKENERERESKGWKVLSLTVTARGGQGGVIRVEGCNNLQVSPYCVRTPSTKMLTSFMYAIPSVGQQLLSLYKSASLSVSEFVCLSVCMDVP